MINEVFLLSLLLFVSKDGEDLPKSLINQGFTLLMIKSRDEQIKNKKNREILYYQGVSPYFYT